ncbi:MAG: MATE family efflux transporter [Eubacteriales bacterium]|nr:MATE family efflux transporter [Eubacteriales bacterium]
MSEKSIVIESKSLYKTLVRVVLPIALQSLIATSLNLVDTLMVGSLGEGELAAVGLSNQFFFIHMGVMFGLSSGAAAFMSQFWGTKDLSNIRKVLGFTITINFCIALFFFLPALLFPESVLRIFTDIPEAIVIGKDYMRIVSFCALTISITMTFTAALRATQQTRIPLFISIIVFSTNTLLNYLLIFGKFGFPALGVTGAAVATLISRLLEIFILYYVIFGRKNLLAGSFREFFGWTKTLAGRVLSSALPVTVNETMWSLGMATYSAFYGRMGVTEFASIQASRTVENLFIMAIFSMGDALLILVGQQIGMGKMDYAYALAKRLIRISLYIGVVSGLLLIITSPYIVGLFNFTPEGRQYTQWILIIYGVFMWLVLYNGISITGTMRCGGDTKHAMVLEVCCVWCIGVPLVFIGVFYLHLPVYYVVLLAQTEEVVKGFLCRSRFYSKKWLKNLVYDL